MGSILNNDNNTTSKRLKTSNGDTIGFPINATLTINDFTFLKDLVVATAVGTFGKVFKVRKNDDGKIYALNIIKKKELLQRKSEETNIKIKRRVLSAIDNPFIISLRYLFQSDTKLYLVLDFFIGSSELFFHLKNEGRFSQKRSKFYSAEIFLALKYLHSNGIIYVDLQPKCILLDDEGHIKITDFQLSKDSLTNNMITHTFCGISQYLAPEIIPQDDKYDKAADWWTFGTLLYEMMTGLPPFYNDKILNYPKYLSKEARSIFTGLLQLSPKKRLSATEIEHHQFYKDMDWHKLYKKETVNNDKIHIKEYNDGIPMSKVDPNFTEEVPRDTLVDKSGLIFAANDMFAGFTYQDNIPYDTEIMIEDVLNGNDVTLNLLKRCLSARGWVKIKYPETINIVIDEVMNNINKWLLESDIDEKLKYSLKLNSGKAKPQSEYGYNKINGFKEGLRILTDDMYKIHYKNNKYPSEIMDDILKINNIFDELSEKIMKIIYNKVYSLQSYKEFGTMYDISLLNENKLKFSMLDFVNYFNDKEYIQQIRNDEKDEKDENDLKPNVLKTAFNVFEHTDPGLFALSFLSTNVGLEMYDNLSHKWIKIGLNQGIWWNGNMSAQINNNIKAGKHRVMIDEKQYKPRFTGWYEVSCNKQLNQNIMKEAIDMNL